MSNQISWTMRALDKVERVGNRLPDPAIIFLFYFVWLWCGYCQPYCQISISVQ
jgi:aminobenzoyl-glutamate transport protein